jgi:PAS domain S-box-containing protein
MAETGMSGSWPLRRLVVVWVLLVSLAMGSWLLLQVLFAADNGARLDAQRRASTELARLSVAAELLVRREPSALAALLAHSMLDPAIERAFIVDPERRIVLSSQGSENGQLLQLAQPGFFALLPQTQASDRLVQVEDPTMQRLVAARALNWPAGEGELRAQARGAVFVVVDLGHMVDLQRRELLRDHVGQGLMLLLASLLLFLGLKWLVARPLDRLREASKRLCDGDLAHRVPGTHVRELDELGHAINDMGARLQTGLQRQLDSEQRFRALTESAPDAIITLGETGHIEQFNSAAERLFGFSAAELLGQPLDSLLPPEVAGGHGAYLTRFAAELPTAGRRMQAGRVVKGVHRDGHILHLEIGISRSRTAGSLSFAAMIRDVSDRVAVEQELDSQRVQLEDQVRQRTAELVLERDRAQAAMRAKNEFLARMSHEIRTPMNAVVGLAHVVRRGAQASQINQLQTLEDSALQLLALVDDILEFTRLEAGQVALLAAPADPRALVHAACLPLAERAARRGVELVEWVDADVPDSVSLDAQRVRQLLGHLVDNAVKFTPAGHITVRVSLCTVGMRFEVQDSGIGMAPDALNRVFKPFEQADPGDARRFGGAGLGLVLTQRLLRLMGAELNAHSQLEQGSRFQFELRAPVVQNREAPQRPRLPARQALVLESNADARAAQLALLRHLGMPAEGASSLDEAKVSLERLAQAGRPVDLCLVDARLLAAPGTEGVPHPAAGEVLGGLRCVLTTLQGYTPPLAQVLRAGYLGVLDKPLAHDTVQDKLSVWLSAPTTQRPAVRTASPQPMAVPHEHLGLDALEALHAVPGLDVTVGLRTLRGDVPAYQRLLRHFVRFHQDDPLRLRHLLDRGAGREVADLAHSLKSSAGAIGAAGVLAAASAMPRSGEPVQATRSAGEELAAQMSVLLAELGRVLDMPGPAPAAPPVAGEVSVVADPAQLRRELRHSLERRDMAALRLLQGEQGAALGDLGMQTSRLRRAVEDFEFDVAIKLLDELESAADKSV